LVSAGLGLTQGSKKFMPKKRQLSLVRTELVEMPLGLIGVHVMATSAQSHEKVI